MGKVRYYVLAGLLLIWLIATLIAYFKEHGRTGEKLGTKFIVRVGVFGAIAAVLYIFIKIPLPIFPSFLEIHIDEIPIFIAGFAYGPFAAVCVTLIKTIIKLPLTSTLGVGEFCDLLFTLAFILPATIIYKRHRTFKGALAGLGIGAIVQIFTAVIGNIYLILPFYMEVMEFSEEAILGMCQKANPAINNVGWAYGTFAVLPFNAIKDSAVIAITLIVYKSIRRIINKLDK